MGYLEFLKKNRRIHYILKGLKRINDEEYRNFFLDREVNPLLIEFETKGNEYKDRPFYVIKEHGKNYGFFAEFHAVLMKLRFADIFGFTPIVVWGKDFLYYDEQKNTNGYESYFKQPVRLGEKDIEKAKLVTYSKGPQEAWIVRTFEQGEDLSLSYEKEMAEIYKKYISFNEIIEKRLAEETIGVLQNKRVLGVHFRGTDFRMNYDNHPVAVNIEQEFEVIDQAMKLHDFEQIFLATDEIKAVDRFRERYGDKIVCYNDVFRGDTNKSVAFSESDREEHHYRLGYEVLRDMYTLSLCDGFIAGISQVSICARIAKRSRSEEYKFLKIIDNGKNHNDKKFG